MTQCFVNWLVKIIKNQSINVEDSFLYTILGDSS